MKQQEDLENLMPQVITEKSKYKIQPKDLHTPGQDMQIQRFSDFDNACEAETAAAWLIFLAQTNRGWRSFTKEELVSFIQKNRNRRSGFLNMYELIERGLIVKEENRFFYTDKFIDRCLI